RLLDLKAFALKLIGLYGIIGVTANNVAILTADVAFTRTNLMLALAVQLNLVSEMVVALRASQATAQIREAEAAASEGVGVGMDALNEATNKALLNFSSTIRSLEATTQAAVKGLLNTKENTKRVVEMSDEAQKGLNDLFATLDV